MDLFGDVPVARVADLDDVRVRGAGRPRDVGGAAAAAHHQVARSYDDRDRRRLLARDARRLADALIRRRGTAHAAAAAALGGRAPRGAGRCSAARRARGERSTA